MVTQMHSFESWLTYITQTWPNHYSVWKSGCWITSQCLPAREICCTPDLITSGAVNPEVTQFARDAQAISRTPVFKIDSLLFVCCLLPILSKMLYQTFTLPVEFCS